MPTILRFAAQVVLVGAVDIARAQSPRVEIILDVSGSMAGAVGSEQKMASARDAILGTLETIDAESQVALRLYGHRVERENEPESCQDTELVVPFGNADRSRIGVALSRATPKGQTPIAHALQEGAKDFGPSKEAERVIVLVSDGEETCGGNPVAVVQELLAQGFKLTVHTIGFDADAAAEEQLKAIAQATGGEHRTAKSGATLSSALNAQVQRASGAGGNFEDYFDRAELGPAYEVLDPDPDRMAMTDGKLLIVANEGNVLKLGHTVAGNFVATLSFTAQLNRGDGVELLAEYDEANLLRLNVRGTFYLVASNPYVQLNFVKRVNGEDNAVSRGHRSSVGERALDGARSEPELWFLQIERSGVTVTARVSADGQEWVDVGQHTFLKQGVATLQFRAWSEGVEQPVYFEHVSVVKK